MKRNKLFIMLTLFVAVMCICSCVTSSGNVDSWYSVNDGKLIVMLEGNATTGYSWVSKIENPGILEVSDLQYIPDELKANSGMVGFGGVWKCEFTAVGPGETTVLFSYERSWEDNSSVEQKKLTVSVSETGQIRVLTE